MLKDSSNKPSATLTFAVITFTVVIINYILSIFEKIGPLNIRSFDATAASALLLPILSLYFSRRYVSDKVTIDNDVIQTNIPVNPIVTSITTAVLPINSTSVINSPTP